MRSFKALAIGVVAATATMLALLELPTSAAQHPESYDPRARVQPIAALDWEERPSIHPAMQFSPVAVDVERIERVHAGMDLPDLRQPDGSPVVGLPYYFFGHDPTTGRYLAEYVAVCIDIFHMSYDIEKDSEYFDLRRLVPADTAREIIDTINSGVQLASEVGLEIRLDGGQPLTVTTEEAGEYLMAAQMKAWHLFARDSLTRPLPRMELSDLSVTRRVLPGTEGATPPEKHDLSEATAAIDELLRRYRSTPSFGGQRFAIDGELVLTDAEALNGFGVEFDADASTPDARDYVDVRTHRDGHVTVTERKPLEGDLTLAFTKEYPHGIGGGDYPFSGVRANANDQTKALISNDDEAAFSLHLTRDAVEEPGTEEPGTEEPETEWPKPPTGPVDDEFDEDVEEPSEEEPKDEEPAEEESGESDAAGDAAADPAPPASATTSAGELPATGTRVMDGAVVGILGASVAVLAGGVAIGVSAVRRRRRNTSVL